MHETKSSSKDEAGFTLIEALVAMVILAFGLIAITNLLLVAASSNSAGNQSSATTALASQELEELKAKKFTDLAPGGSLTSDVSVSGTPYFRDDNIDGVGPIHTRWEIANISGDQQTKFIQVRSEPKGGLMATRARAEFTTYRSCTSVAGGCPAP